MVALATTIATLGGNTKVRAYSTSPVARLVMGLAMARPAFQTQLFRFVDVFPAMRDDADTARHLSQYFAGGATPGLLAKAAAAAPVVPGGSRAAARIARREISKMARQFIIGATPAEAVEVLGTLWRGGTAATIDLLGEHTVSHREAAAYAERLDGLLGALLLASESWPVCDLLENDDLGRLPRVAVSIKATALAPDFAPLTAEAGLSTAKSHLRPLLADAARRGVQVWFDLERYETKELTYRLFQELISEPGLEHLHAGIVVQAYLRDSVADLGRLIAFSRGREVPIAIRLVKGAYYDTETVVARSAGWPVPVYSYKAETDLCYEHCIRILHAHHKEVRAAFASHNLRSLAYAIEAARKEGIPDNGYEVQLLYGMAEPVHEAIRRLGLRLRVYAPMGELVPGMAYLVRRLLENTSQESFVRNRFGEGKELPELVARPRLRAESLSAAEPAKAAPRTKGALRTKGTSGDGPSVASSRDDYRPEPLAEWFRSEVSEQMGSAVRKISRAGHDTGPSAQRGRADGLLFESGWSFGAERCVPARIGGRSVSTARTIPSLDPADPDRIVATSACCGPDEVAAAVEACQAAFPAWSLRPTSERAGVLFRAAQWLRERRFEVAALEVFEAGKTWADADGDVCEAIDYLEYYGREALVMAQGGRVLSAPGETNTLSYRGRGVTAVIAPWNFPLAIPTGMVSAALVTGNCVVFKPAEQTPATASILVEALECAGLPAGVLSFVPGLGEEIGDGLVTHRDVVGVIFTGSRAVGLHLVEIASITDPEQREVRRVFAEMGGKNALIIDTDADLDVAVPAALQSAFGFAGQRCSAASRIVLPGATAEGFLERFVEAVRALRIGPPMNMGTEMGPLIDEDALRRVRKWQGDASDYGRVLLRREDLPARGYFVGPTVVDFVEPGSPLAREEIFGPVVAILRASDFDHAIEIANMSSYGLTAGVVSRSPSHIAKAAEQLDAGNIYINRPIVGAVVGRQPFGGHRMSGYGQKAGGPDYLYQFVEPRVVTENTMRQGFAPLE